MVDKQAMHAVGQHLADKSDNPLCLIQVSSDYHVSLTNTTSSYLDVCTVISTAYISIQEHLDRRGDRDVTYHSETSRETFVVRHHKHRNER